MSATSLLGLAAATCTTVAFVPQLVRIVRTRSSRDVSLATFVVMSTGVLLWFIYGLLIHDLPLILANGITLALCLTILALMLRRGSA